MADLTSLVDSADCTTPGCPNEADRADGLCRVCRTVPSRRTLLQPTPTHPGALAHLITDDDTPPDEEPAMPTPPPLPLTRPRTRPWTRDEALAHGLVFFERTGRPPLWGELKNRNGLPNHQVIDRLFGSLASFQSIISAASARPIGAQPPASEKAPQTASAPRPAAPPTSETPSPAPARLAEAGTTLVDLARRVEDARTDLQVAVDNLRQAVEELAA